MVGVQSLSIALSVALVASTGIIVGVLSITSGNELINDARTTGDQGVSTCLTSGDRDLRIVANRYFQRVTGSVEDRMKELFGTATFILETGARMGRSVPPDWMTGRGARGGTFLDEAVRQFMFQSLGTAYPRGIDRVIYRWGNATGEMHFYRMPLDQAFPRDDMEPWGMLETRAMSDPTMQTVGENMFIENFGANDRMGNFADRGKPCWIYINPPGSIPDLKVDTYGDCIVPRGTFASSMDRRIMDRMFLNAQRPDTKDYPLEPADTIVASPFNPYIRWMLVQLHVAFTHPDYTNDDFGARQGNRVGVFSVGLNGDAITDIFASTNVPAQATLFAVDKDPWSGVVGQLIANTHGQLTHWEWVENPNIPGVNMRQRTPIFARDHTYDENTTSLSMVGNVTRYIEANGGFEAMAVQTKSEFVEWHSGGAADTQFWFSVLHVKYQNLNWFITLMVPRSSIMAEIDASVQLIKDQNTAAKTDAEDKQRDTLILTVVVAVAVAGILLGASVMVTKMILSPLLILANDMAQVACMNVEKVDLEGDMSALSEVRSMQSSFRQMVKNLIEYKSYMPQAVIILTADDPEEVDAESSVASERPERPHQWRVSTLTTNTRVSVASSNVRSGASPAGSPRTSTASSAPRSPLAHNPRARRATAAAMLFSDTSLKVRPVSIVCYNIVGWSKVLCAMSDKDVQALYTSLTSTLLTGTSKYKGVTDLFSGDRFLISYNAFTNCGYGAHKENSVMAALQVQVELQRLEDHMGGKLMVSYGAASGDAKVGNMGCPGMKKATINSGAVPLAVACEKYNHAHGYKGVVDHMLKRDVNSCQFRKVDMATFSKRGTKLGKPVGALFEIVGEQHMATDEWMYQLEMAKASNPYTAWDDLFDMLEIMNKADEGLEKEQKEAKEKLAGIPETLINKADRMRMYDMCSAGELKLVDLN
eukprot:Hpha_TRINITY_DN16533_c1_g5::TRINITY_DN16533_c1_g5_i2::g.132526::m.132526